MVLVCRTSTDIVKQRQRRQTMTADTFVAEADAAYQREMAEVREAMNILTTSSDYDDARDKVEEVAGTPLEVTQSTVTKVLLGTGGPASGYYIFHDADRVPESGFYWYQNWGTSKRVYWLDRDELAAVVSVYDVPAGDY